MTTPSEDPGEITLRLLRVGATPVPELGEGVLRVLLQTTRGDIRGVLHPVEGGASAVVAVSGARGGLDGPAGGLYGRLAPLLAAERVTLLRLDYREPNHFEECVADVLAGCSFMTGIGAAEMALVGHSFGAAVVIRAGEINPAVRGVAALSPQLSGTGGVHRLGAPLLLVHGTGDTILSHEASEELYRRAAEPKQLVLYQEAGHGLAEAAADLDALLAEWLRGRLAGEPAPSGRDERIPPPPVG